MCVCVYNQGTPLLLILLNYNSLPAVSFVYLFLGLQNRTSSIDRLTEWWGTETKKKFPLFGKGTASFIEKELLPNAHLIDCNTIKYVFRRRTVQKQT